MLIASVDLDQALSLGGRVKKVTGILKKKDGTQSTKGKRAFLAVETSEQDVLLRAVETGLGFADFLLWKGEEEPDLVGTRLSGKTSWVLPSLEHLESFQGLGATPVFAANASTNLRVLTLASIQCSQLRIVGEPVLRVPGLRTGFLEELSSTNLVVRHSVDLPSLQDLGEYEILTARIKEPRGERTPRSGKTRVPREPKAPKSTVVDSLFGASRVSF